MFLWFIIRHTNDLFINTLSSSSLISAWVGINLVREHLLLFFGSRRCFFYFGLHTCAECNYVSMRLWWLASSKYLQVWSEHVGIFRFMPADWKRLISTMKAPVSKRVLGVAGGRTLDSCIPITASIWGLLLPPASSSTTSSSSEQKNTSFSSCEQCRETKREPPQP